MKTESLTGEKKKINKKGHTGTETTVVDRLLIVETTDRLTELETMDLQG